MKKWYLKERHNPQFDKPYYIPLGQISKAEAKRKEKSLYGTNYVFAYDTLDEYEKAISNFKSQGFSIQ